MLLVQRISDCVYSMAELFNIVSNMLSVVRYSIEETSREKNDGQFHLCAFHKAYKSKILLNLLAGFVQAMFDL